MTHQALDPLVLRPPKALSTEELSDCVTEDLVFKWQGAPALLVRAPSTE